ARCAWGVVVGDAVAGAHQLLAGVVVVDLGHGVVGVVGVSVDILKDLQAGLVGATVQRAGQCVDAAGGGGQHVGVGGTDHADRGGGAVLLVVSVQDQRLVERVDADRLNLVRLGRVAEHAAQGGLASSRGGGRIE